MGVEVGTIPAGPELTIVVPTFNERENVSILPKRLAAVLAGVDWEIVYVDDDSPDDTATEVRRIAMRDRRVRIIRRLGRRGLASACVEGILSSSAPFVAVMDADLQHDERLLREMLQRLKAEALDIVVASRYVAEGSVDGWDASRAAISRIGARVAKIVMKADVKDPMSGFFMMRRESFDQSMRCLSQHGFKILLDLFVSAPRPLRFLELSYSFQARQFGESKFDAMAAWEFGVLVLDKLFGRFLPVRFILFAMVGRTGLVVHLAILGLIRHAAPFVAAQTVAVVGAMTWNFFLNNTITYRDRRLKGRAILGGILIFYLVCAAGAVANVGAASLMFGIGRVWWVAGLAGALIGAVWNYAATSFFTWKQSRRSSLLLSSCGVNAGGEDSLAGALLNASGANPTVLQ
jgi:dolichol-phosphate mannosyltransferase